MKQDYIGKQLSSNTIKYLKEHNFCFKCYKSVHIPTHTNSIFIGMPSAYCEDIPYDEKDQDLCIKCKVRCNRLRVSQFIKSKLIKKYR